MILTSRIIRCAVQAGAPFAKTPLLDTASGETIEAVRGNATAFQFGFFDAAGEPLDLSQVETLNLRLRASQTAGSTVLADATLSAEDLDLALTAETWEAGTAQHAEFALTSAEMNLDPGGAKKALWLVVTAILNDGSEVTLCGGTLVFHEDNNGAGDPPPENPGLAVTIGQGDARWLQLEDFTPGNLGLTTAGLALATLTNPSAITFLRVNADNTANALSASDFRTAIGLTTAGNALATLTNPSAITFLRVNADNTVSALSAADFRTAIGAGATGADLFGAATVAAAMAAMGRIEAWKTADEGRTSASYAADTHLVLSLAANTQYRFEFFVPYEAASGGSTISAYLAYSGTFAAETAQWDTAHTVGSTRYRWSQVSPSGVAENFLTASSAADGAYHLIGSICTANAGDLAIWWGNPAAAGTANVMKGAWAFAQAKK